MRVQMIAYEIDTHDTVKLAAILTARGVTSDEMSEENYFDQQVNVLRDLIRNHVQPLTRADHLTVFSVPEFYFKYQNGMPYSRTTFFNRLEYLKAISSAFPRVMIVAGTIWWMEPATGGQATIHNTVPILYAGNLIHTWQKERLSGIDGLDQDGGETWDRWEEQGGRILEDTQDPFFQVTVNGETIRLGVEICLDHLTLRNNTGQITARGVLRTKYLAENGDEGPGVDIHLLVAAGMPQQPENILSRHDGLYFRVDGGGGAIRSNCYRVQRPGPLTQPQALRQWNPTLNNIARNNSPGARGVDGDTNDRIAIYGVVEI